MPDNFAFIPRLIGPLAIPQQITAAVTNIQDGEFGHPLGCPPQPSQRGPMGKVIRLHTASSAITR